MKYNSDKETGEIYCLFRYTGQNELLTSGFDQAQQYIYLKIVYVRDHEDSF
jgi:hypothetical protein